MKKQRNSTSSKNRTPTLGYNLRFQKIEGTKTLKLYTTHVEKVILVSTIPSNPALDAQGNEETNKFNLLETEQ